MSEKMTLLLNDKEYEMNAELREAVEKRARAEFSENDFFDCWWSINERGDPILNIETEGHYVPWDRLERLEFEMVPEDGTDSDEAQDLDSGNGMKSVPKDDVDMGTPDDPSEHGEEEPDTTFMMTHPSRHYIPQPEQDGMDKLPPDPEELPEDPSFIAWVPDDGRSEIWSTGRSLIPTSMFLEWNVQIKADEAPDGATKIVPDSDGHVSEEQRTTSHDSWEALANKFDCKIVSKKKQSSKPPEKQKQQEGYSGREASGDVGGIAGGNNWNFGN